MNSKIIALFIIQYIALSLTFEKHENSKKSIVSKISITEKSHFGKKGDDKDAKSPKDQSKKGQASKDQKFTRYEFLRMLENQLIEQYERDDLKKLKEKKEKEKKNPGGKAEGDDKDEDKEEKKEEKKDEEEDKEQKEKEDNLEKLKKKSKEVEKKMLEDDLNTEILLRKENAKKLKDLVHGIDVTNLNTNINPNQELLKQGIALFKTKGYTPAEIYIIEKSADKFADARITFEEMLEFISVFVQPFLENCSPDENYKVAEKNIKKCLAQPEFKYIRGIYSENLSELEKAVILFMRNDRTPEMSFSDYVLIRRAQTAVKTCGNKNGVGKVSFSCALQITVPNSEVYSAAESGVLFDLSVSMRSNLQENRMFVDILSLALLGKYLSWNNYIMSGLPGNTVSKDKFKEAINKNEFPLGISNHQSDYVFEFLNVEELQKTEFIALMYATGLIKQNRISSEFTMCALSWKKLLLDPTFNSLIVESIDNSPIKENNELQTINSVLSSSQKEAADDAFITFIERKSKVSSASQISMEEKEKRRISMYKIIGFEFNKDISRKEALNPTELFLFLKSSWFFLALDINGDKELSLNELVPKGMDLNTPLRMNNEDKRTLNDVNSLNKAVSILNFGVKLNLRHFIILFFADELYKKAKKEKDGTMTSDLIHDIFMQLGLPYFNTKSNKGSFEKNISRGEYLEMIKRFLL